MSSQEAYNDLLRQYEELSLEEKNAILIYKSRLYNIINAMSSIPNFLNINEEELLDQLDKGALIKLFESYKKVVFSSKNITIRYTIFTKVDFTNILTCMKSLKEVYKTIQQTKGKIKLKEKLTVYRGVNLETNETPTMLARGDILSTGLKLEDAFKFLLYYPNNHLYVIEVEAGANVLVTPYALVLTYPLGEDQLQNIFQQKPPDILKVKRLGSRVEEEVILFQSELEFDEIMFKVKYLGDYEHPINTHYIKAYPKSIVKEVKK